MDVGYKPNYVYRCVSVLSVSGLLSYFSTDCGFSHNKIVVLKVFPCEFFQLMFVSEETSQDSNMDFSKDEETLIIRMYN